MKARAKDIACPECGERMKWSVITMWDQHKTVETCYKCETVTESYPWGQKEIFTMKEYMGDKEYKDYHKELKKRGLKYYDYKGD